MVSFTLLIAGFIGLLLGLALSVTRPGGVLANRGFNATLNFLVNVFRPIPFIILVAVLGPLTKVVTGSIIGTNAGIFVMIVGGVFSIARIVEQNLVAVDPGVIEAVRATGARPLRIIATVLIPEALGPLVLGYTYIVIGIVDMSAMVGAIGGGGLGDFALTRGYQVFRWDVTLVATAVIILLVQLLQFLGNRLARKALRQ
ncbi:methionine ABC transporter permease [Leucobacter sp. UT-8R-CII-1-4]|uniref:methionine ABC transporter permease n=1 Tax=Leucobacter sp. UT-8R-CII-1-4 TaxID=3040075 RepID=UPI0024A7E9B4|nr:methionine ABC transporter permease [Leucobacter sp. UT-8R-CII-1-4]MDI6023666.1 methionine ABC transporter permease [Leucobacter sp. UT-8R-CII-1-4]